MNPSGDVEYRFSKDPKKVYGKGLIDVIDLFAKGSGLIDWYHKHICDVRYREVG